MEMMKGKPNIGTKLIYFLNYSLGKCSHKIKAIEMILSFINLNSKLLLVEFNLI